MRVFSNRIWIWSTQNFRVYIQFLWTNHLCDICLGSLSWHSTEGPCGMAGLWHPLLRASMGGGMSLSLPTMHAHSLWLSHTYTPLHTHTHANTAAVCRRPSRTTETERKRHRRREWKRARERFCACRECKMGGTSKQKECVYWLGYVDRGVFLCVCIAGGAVCLGVKWGGLKKDATW